MTISKDIFRHNEVEHQSLRGAAAKPASNLLEGLSQNATDIVARGAYILFASNHGPKRAKTVSPKDRKPDDLPARKTLRPCWTNFIEQAPCKRVFSRQS